ncbi:hypothetical protein D3C81_1534290 [compost metagenome]
MPSAMPMLKPLLVPLAALLLLSGCMRYHDERIREVQPHQCAFDQGALFQNQAYYTSAGGQTFPFQKLSALFGNYDKRIALLKLRTENGQLHAAFLTEDQQPLVGEKATIELSYKAKGPALIIDNPSSCRFAETGVECSSWHVELSCTQHDDLALKRVDSGTGMIGLIIPINSRSSTLGIYRRVEAEAKPDEVR